MTNLVQDFASRLLPSQKRSPNGWLNANCPACTSNGEPTPDTKKRLGLYLESNGGIKYHCFRCSWTASWFPGQSLNKKIKKTFYLFGANPQEVLDLNLECLKLKQTFDTEHKIKDEFFSVKEVTLPKDSNSFNYWLEQENIPDKFLEAVKYLIDRNEYLLEWFIDWHWSPIKDFEDRIIIPLRHNKQIVGWTSRLARPQKYKTEPKYLLDNTDKTLFNIDVLQDNNKKYVILVEGPLDAIVVDGVAVLGNQITKRQIEILNKSDKEIIVLPDKDEGGQKLIDAAIANGWNVSLPDTIGHACKDALDMANIFGRLMTVKMIFDSVINNHVQLEIKRKNWS